MSDIKRLNSQSASGIDGTTSCVAVSKATTPEEQVHATTLSLLDEAEIGPAPVILLIGQAIRPNLQAK